MIRKKVFVALSGGVDSSVAAALLKYGDARLPALPVRQTGGRQGFDVYGIHIKMWSPEGSNQQPATGYQHDVVCRQQHQDRIDAMAVAAHLEIPFQTWDFTEEYRRAVVEYMIGEYAGGRTPNPDVMCNREIKFGLFLKKALEQGADYITTGHYVLLNSSANNEFGTNIRIAETEFVYSEKIRYSLMAAHDAQKDQSYFLWTLTQNQLRHCLFPIGEYTKPEVREMARKFNLPTAEKPDSQGICFIGEIDLRQFLKNYIPEHRGRVLTTAGKAVGEHGGVEFYTIGQREGIGIGGGIPYYVAGKDSTTNTLIVAEGPYDEKLFQKELIAADVNWISGREPKFPLRCEARIRYRQPLQTCIVKPEAGSGELAAAKLKVIFNEAQRAVTPGQSIVFYKRKSFDPASSGTQKLELLGGGIIV